MTTITIKNVKNISRTEFEDWEDLLDYIKHIVKAENFELSSEHIKILEEREKEADNATDKGLSWEEVKKGIRRNHA
ncbi:MAG: addiction module protein [Chlorobi bacterium]|nr:addiction module protein [Chlorobiota bacterium]